MGVPCVLGECAFCVLSGFALCVLGECALCVLSGCA